MTQSVREREAYIVEPVMYARDVDGTGSLHVCAKGDPGAIALYAKPQPSPNLSKAVEALKPFALAADDYGPQSSDDHDENLTLVSHTKIGDLRRAREALKALKARP